MNNYLDNTITSISVDEGDKTRTVYLFGVGFDEKLVIRAVLRVGVKPEEVVILVYGSTTTGELEKTKVENAVRNLRKILEGSGIYVIEISIGARNFPEDVNSVIGYLKKVDPERVVVSLGSGMRYVAFVLLFSCILYRELFKRDVKIVAHVAREDGLYDIATSLDLIRITIGRRELDALCLLYGKALRRDEAVKKGVETFGIKSSTFYRLLNRIERDGLIVIKNGIVEMTELGEVVAMIKCGERMSHGVGHGQR